MKISLSLVVDDIIRERRRLLNSTLRLGLETRSVPETNVVFGMLDDVRRRRGGNDAEVGCYSADMSHPSKPYGCIV
jgi:hypothetical protein